MRSGQAKIFGPVLVVIPHNGDDDTVRIANDSDYGLGGFVYTADEARGTALARRIEAGSIGVNHHTMAISAPSGATSEVAWAASSAPKASVHMYRPSRYTGPGQRTRGVSTRKRLSIRASE